MSTLEGPNVASILSGRHGTAENYTHSTLSPVDSEALRKGLVDQIVDMRLINMAQQSDPSVLNSID